MENRFRELAKSKTIPGLLSIALGIIMIIARRAALDLLVRIIGGIVLTGGLAFLAVSLVRPDIVENAKNNMIMAALMILAGLILILSAESIVDFFPTLMGILLILNGLSHLAAAGADRENRMFDLLIGIVTMILGILIVMQPGAIANMAMVFIGASFVANGLFDLFMVRRMY